MATMIDQVAAFTATDEGEVLQEEQEARRLRCMAAELVLRGDWKAYILLYSKHISQLLLLLLQQQSESNNAKRYESLLCSALANRADVHLRLLHHSAALNDCDAALRINPDHSKSLICKGKSLLNLHRYSQASLCFRRALQSSPEEHDSLRRLLDRSRRLESQSKTGALDLSQWVLKGNLPEDIAEYIGPVEIRRSELSGRGLFITKAIDAGTPLVIAQAVATGRGLLPCGGGDDIGESARMVMWKDLVNRVLLAAEESSRTLQLLNTLSTGEEEDESLLQVPDINVFKLDSESTSDANQEEAAAAEEKPVMDVERIMKVLDVNCLTEDEQISQNNSAYAGVGLWILPSFVNHSCAPNARRLHVGNWLVIYASRSMAAEEEMTLPYFDVLTPLQRRREMSNKWGFHCICQRCLFEEEEDGDEKDGFVALKDETHDLGDMVARLEDKLRRFPKKQRKKGFLRASFWAVYSAAYQSENVMKRWRSKLPAEMAVVESVSEAVGGDERVLKVLLQMLKRNGSLRAVMMGGNAAADMEKALRLGRGVYGKLMKTHAMRALFENVLESPE